MTNTAEHITIGLAGTYTVDPLTRYLKKDLEDKGIAVGNFLVAPYNQITQLSLNPEALLEGTPDILVVFWRLEDIGLGELDNFLNTLKVLRQNFQGSLIVSNCPYPSTPDFDVHELHQDGTAYFHALQTFTDTVQEIDNTHVLNVAGLMQHIGSQNAHDVRKWYLYKNPYTR